MLERRRLVLAALCAALLDKLTKYERQTQHGERFDEPQHAGWDVSPTTPRTILRLARCALRVGSWYPDETPGSSEPNGHLAAICSAVHVSGTMEPFFDLPFWETGVALTAARALVAMFPTTEPTGRVLPLFVDLIVEAGRLNDRQRLIEQWTAGYLATGMLAVGAGSIPLAIGDLLRELEHAAESDRGENNYGPRVAFLAGQLAGVIPVCKTFTPERRTFSIAPAIPIGARYECTNCQLTAAAHETSERDARPEAPPPAPEGPPPPPPPALVYTCARCGATTAPTHIDPPFCTTVGCCGKMEFERVYEHAPAQETRERNAIWGAPTGLLFVRLSLAFQRNEVQLCYADDAARPAHYQMIARMTDFRAQPYFGGYVETQPGLVSHTLDGTVVRRLATDQDIEGFALTWGERKISLLEWLDDLGARSDALEASEKLRLRRIVTSIGR